MSDYSAEWRKYHFWTHVRGVFVIPLAVLVIAEMSFGTLTRFPQLLYLVFIVAVLGAVLSQVKLLTFPCPRCTKPFNALRKKNGEFYRIDLGYVCPHCGLRRDG